MSPELNGGMHDMTFLEMGTAVLARLYQVVGCLL